MGFVIALAFASGFLLIFGLNLLYTEVRSERDKDRRTQVRQESRSRQTERARLAVQHRDLYEMAAISQPGRPSLAERLEMSLEQTGMPKRRVMILFIGATLASVAAILLGVISRHPVFGVVVALLFFAPPIVYVAIVRRRRIDKPDNIMLDTDGEPVIMDFGLARRVDDDVRLSKTGVLIGSPAYMSPEQIEGDQSKIGLATDIYSLGVVLFEMLTKRIPFSGSLLSLLRNVAETPPPRPTELVPELGNIPGVAELEKYSLKMMAKKPQGRFASAGEIAEAMEPLRLGASRSSRKSGKWLKRIWPFRAAGSF